MPVDDAQDWSPKAVLDRLASGKDPVSPVSVQLFLSERVGGEDLARFVESAAKRAAAKLGIAPHEVRIGAPLKLARSIAMVAPLHLVRDLMSQDEFVDLLPSDLDDAMIKPVRKDR
jgi:hypothetical protein